MVPRVLTRFLGKKAFTLTEIMMGVLVFAILLFIVTALQSGGSKAVTRISWHGQVNQQGAFLEKFIPRAIEKSSVPSVITTTGTNISNSAIHAITAVSGATVTASGTAEKIVLAIPQSTPVPPGSTAGGKVKWVELVLVPETSGYTAGYVGKLYTRERSVLYTSGNYSSIARPTSGGNLDFIMDDVSKVVITQPGPGTETICLTITATYPRDRLNSQKFVIHATAQGRAPISIP